MEKFENKFLYAEKRVLPARQVQVECSISTNGENLSKILSLCANANVLQVETRAGEAVVGGEVFSNLLFLTDDERVNNLTAVCDFQEIFKDELLNEDSKLCARAKVVSVSPTKVQENQVVMNVLVEISVYDFSNRQMSVVDSFNDDINVLEDLIKVNVLKGHTKQDFEVETKFTSKDQIEKILFVDSNVCLKDTVSADGFVVVSGEICSYVTYVNQDGNLCKCQICEQFKEEIQVENAQKAYFASSLASVRKSQIKTTLNQGESENNVSIVSPVYVCVNVFGEEEIVVPTDLYSVRNEVELVRNDFVSTFNLPSKTFETKIEGNLTLDENQPRIDKILCVTSPNLNVSNAYFNDGELFVEGVVTANVVYLNDDENIITSVELEVPFVSAEKLNLDESQVLVCTSCMLYDCDVMAKRGREIYFDCKMKVHTNNSFNREFNVITDIVLGRALAQSDSSIEIFFAKPNQTHWEIAKELKISKELLVKQNPNLKDPTEKDERVVVYYGIEN